jgi:hypothetical protein
VAGVGCKTEPPSTAPDAGQPGDGGPPEAAPAAPVVNAPTDSPGSDEIHPVYPRDAGPPDPLAQRFCDAVYGTPARRAAECCGGPPSGTVAAFAGECVRVLTYAMSTQAIRVAPADVDACAAAIDKVVVGCDWVTLKFSVPAPPACDGILKGQLKEKAACRSSLECEPGLRCQGLSTIDLGVCGPPRPAGQECNLAVDTLASLTRQDHYARAHAECEGYCKSMRCQAPIPAGGACVSDAVCGALRCEAGKCTSAPPPGAGEACTAACAFGLRCLEGKCTPPRAEGEACKSAVECRGACVTGDGGAEGTCGKTCTMQLSLPKPPPPKAPPRPTR